MKKNKLKFLIIGLGSMGKRRIRNLLTNGEKEIIGFDIRSDRNVEAEEKYHIETIDSMNKIASKDYDAMIISTPPDSHGSYIRMALKDGRHFFVEHPVSTDGYKEIFANESTKIVKAPSCTLRFYAPVKMLKNLLEKSRVGKVLAFQYHMGQYLPDWHPWEDYRGVYFSKKKTGACREMFAFELIWLNWLIDSKIKEISGFADKISDLKMGADDIFMANLKYKDGIMGNVMIDVLSRKAFRTLRILGTNGVLEWEKSNSLIRIFDAKTKKLTSLKVSEGRPEKGYINEEKMYNDEIKAFIDAIRKKNKYPYTFKDSLEVLTYLSALEKSSKTGRKIYIKK